MELPKNIYPLVQEHMGHHGCWHKLRREDFNQEARNRCFSARGPSHWPWPKGLKEQGQQGSGDDFLKFHRLMIQNFKWIVENAPGPRFSYIPWQQFPGWLIDIFKKVNPKYVIRVNEDLDGIVHDSTKTSDDLGSRIEGPQTGAAFPNIHSNVHGAVHDYEFERFGSQTTSCDMGKASVAMLNVHFWGFHGWIDNYYASWQISHGEPVDQSPVKPVTMREMCADCGPGALDPTDDAWVKSWHAYIEAQS
jgi:hypothetical protein